MPLARLWIMDWILHLNIHSTVRQETQALGHNRSFARRAKTQLFRERESPNETALKLPASIAAPCCLSPLAPLHVRPSHMRRETSLFAAWAWRLHAPQARGRAAALRARTEARVPLRPRCEGAVLRACEGAPEGACSLSHRPPHRPPVCVCMYVRARVCCVYVREGPRPGVRA